jgi:hypothetical protein
MKAELYKDIPTWENGTWTTTTFETLEEFRDFVLSLFKIPGEYQFNETTNSIFNEQGEAFNSKKVYCLAPFKSKDFIHFWDFEKEKNRKGLIVKDKDLTWYLPREYYMWLNYLPIYDKEEQRFNFPKIRDAQYHMALYEMLAELHYKHCSVLKKRQFGSEQPHSEPILGKDGWITMGQVKEGDLLWNPDGTLTKVLHKIPNGLKDVYEFTFSDGRTTRCGDEHNWEVYDKSSKKKKVLNTKALLEIGLYQTPIKGVKKNYLNPRFFIEQTQGIDFKHKKDPLIDPYLFGIIIGDGSCGNTTVAFTTNDTFIKNHIEELIGSDYTLKEELPNVETTARRWRITYDKRFDFVNQEEYKYGVNPIIRELKKLNIQGKTCYTKFLPLDILESSIEYRKAVLQGLMDSDGFINSKGLDIHYTTCNFKLADDVALLCRSLGIKTQIYDSVIKGITYKRVRLSGDIKFNIFRLPRKLDRFKLRSKKRLSNLTALVSIKKLDYQEESSCIVVDNPNHLYITKDYIVTHNSYYHMAKLLNQLWFEEGVVLKIGASLKDYINEKGSWKFLNEYAAFLNEHTAWYRPMTPNKVLMWQQKIEVKKGDRKTELGLKGTIQGTSFEKDPTNSVGGPVKYFFHEEAGVAPKMDVTYEYIRPALRAGMITTGTFIAAGTVGDLDQCEPLKEFTLFPENNDMYAVDTDLIDGNGTTGKSALFIPEQWAMPPYIDPYGNSQVGPALKALDEQFAIWKKELTPEQYQLRISQHPRNIKEAFDYRTVSKFPTHLISAQMKRIEDKTYSYEYLDLLRTETGIQAVKSSKQPIDTFPIDKKREDKEGCLVVWERPVKDPSFGMYYASIDPVGEGKVTTSESLCSIYVMKAAVEVTKINGTEIETYIEPSKIVAAWCGRFDDLNKTHLKLELIIEYYNAWTVIESNVSLFIQYMIKNKKQKYLVPKSQIMFLKDLNSNANVFQEYGWKNTGNLFKAHLINYAIEYTKEELDQETTSEGKVVRTTFGIERIPDPMLLVEMQQYQDGLNVDRLVAFTALAAFLSVQESNRGFMKRVVKDDAAKNLDKSNNLYKLNYTPFRNMGNNSVNTLGGFKKSPFKNIK